MIYLVESIQQNSTTILKEFHRNSDGTSSVKDITNFKPYIFVDEGAPVESINGVLKTESGYTSINDTPVKKVFVSKTTDIKSLRDFVTQRGFNHWEADVLFSNRYLIDKPPEEEIVPLKVCWFDIETAHPTDENDSTFPDIESANHVICSIAASINGEKCVWLCGKKNVPGTRFFPNELDMLNDFFLWVYKESPDIISAWNLSFFDLPYIIHRAKRIGADYKRLSKIQQIWEKNTRNGVEYYTYGTVQLDALDAYKLWRKYGNLPKLSSYSLNSVAKTVLNDQKTDHGKTVTWLWYNNPELLIEYNVHDVELLEEIDNRCKIIRFFDSMRRMCQVQFTDVYRTSVMIDGYLMSRLNKSVILPTGKFQESEKFGGAVVFEPTPGVYENVLCLDVASMYPSIIKNYNISFETVGGTGIVLPVLDNISFSKKPGIIPMFLDELKRKRDHYKRLRNVEKKGTPEYELYDQRQYAAKVISNSFFGYLGFPSSRLYKKEVAASITGMGQVLIKKISSWAGERGNRAIYGDTDSALVTSNKTDIFEIIEEGIELTKHINQNLDEYNKILAGKNNIFLEFEKVLKKVLFTEAKKRYAYIMLWDADKKFNVSDKIILSGFDAKRSDSAQLSKEVQLEVINKILNGKMYEEVITYLQDINKRMKNREYGDEYIGIPKGITKDLYEYNPPSAVIKGAMFSNIHFNTNFGKGTKPKYVYITSYKGEQPTIQTPIKTYTLESIAYEKEIPEGFDIDWPTMCDKLIKDKVLNLFYAMGWEWVDLNNKTLFSF